jgi:hypothetical protein
MQGCPTAAARGNATLVVVILLAAAALAVGNVAILLETVPRPEATFGLHGIADLYGVCAPCLIYFIAAPMLAGIVMALLVREGPALTLSAPARTQPQPAAPPGSSATAAALRLLGMLQQEARFIDFVAENLDAYSDAQVGAAVRSIHAGCRKLFNERLQLERIYTADEGSTVVIEPGFDPATVRLAGNVSGVPPFSGTLQHGGWRALSISLGAPTAADPSILAPAEVEIP